MKKLELNPDFTMDDIRKLRDYNSVRHINMTANGINEDSRQNVELFHKRMAELRKNKKFVQI
jgi:hypothetical protein